MVYKKLTIAGLIILCLFGIALNVNAATVTWTGLGADNLASTPANWSGGAAPQYGDDVVFDSTSVNNCTWDYDVTLNSLTNRSAFTGQITKISTVTLAIANNFVTPPTATTNSATNITANSVTLNGVVNPNGSATTANFQWGTTTGYGNTTSIQSIGSGTSNVSVTANLTGLSSGTTYHYRIVATNAGGTSNGSDISFTTTTGTPNISASPTSKDYGNINVGSSSSQIFTITNTGTANLVIGTLTLSGTNLDQFVMQNDNCTGKTIAPSATCTIEILFFPSYVGTLTANLNIPSNDPDTPTLSVNLSGTGMTGQCL